MIPQIFNEIGTLSIIWIRKLLSSQMVLHWQSILRCLVFTGYILYQMIFSQPPFQHLTSIKRWKLSRTWPYQWFCRICGTGCTFNWKFDLCSPVEPPKKLEYLNQSPKRCHYEHEKLFLPESEGEGYDSRIESWLVGYEIYKRWQVYLLVKWYLMNRPWYAFVIAPRSVKDLSEPDESLIHSISAAGIWNQAWFKSEWRYY